MSASKTIKKILLDKGMSVKDLANILGTTQQILSNKFYRDTFSYKEYIKIVNLLGCEVKTINKENNIEYLNINEMNK